MKDNKSGRRFEKKNFSSSLVVVVLTLLYSYFTVPSAAAALGFVYKTLNKYTTSLVRTKNCSIKKEPVFHSAFISLN